MKLRLLKRSGHCVCGLKVSHHFDAQNRKHDCAEAARLHPRARRKYVPLSALTVQACFNRSRVYLTGLRPTHGIVIGVIGASLL